MVTYCSKKICNINLQTVTGTNLFCNRVTIEVEPVSNPVLFYQSQILVLEGCLGNKKNLIDVVTNLIWFQFVCCWTSIARDELADFLGSFTYWPFRTVNFHLFWRDSKGPFENLHFQTLKSRDVLEKRIEIHPSKFTKFLNHPFIHKIRNAKILIFDPLSSLFCFNYFLTQNSLKLEHRNKIPLPKATKFLDHSHACFS